MTDKQREPVRGAAVVADAADREACGRAMRTRGRWRVLRNQAGFAYAIARGRWTILHLDAGTTRNEACVDAVVRVLNGEE